MFIELAEFLRCPEDHPAAHCVVLPSRMVERQVVEGVVGCPACQREYPVHDGVVRFGDPPHVPAAGVPSDPLDVAALLGVSTPGGHVILVGSAARLALGLAPVMEGVNLVTVNGPDGVASDSTRLEATATIPLRDAMARGVVLGGEYTSPAWTAEAVRVLLPGLRLVVLRENVDVEGIGEIVQGSGMLAGRKEK